MLRARHLVQSSAIVIFLFALGKVVGLFRARFIAQAFGTGSDFDAFTAANQLPEVFFTVIAGGSLAAAFIPVYSQYLSQENRANSTKLANTIITLVILLLGGISLLGAIFAPWLTRFVLVPDFPPATQELTAAIMRIILIQTTIFGIGGVISSILNAHQHFFLPALAPLSLDIGYFIGIFLLVPTYGILGLAWGTVIGGLLFVAIQIPGLIRYKVRLRPNLAWHLPGVTEIIRLMGPRIITLGVIQFADLFVIRLASGLPAGATSAYFYAYALMQFPQTLFGTAIALVVFPTLAEMYNAQNIDGLKKTAANTLAIIWALTIPAAVGTLMLGQPIIAFLFQGGQFDANATQLVFTVLAVFSIRIVSESTLEVVARLFYARHNTRTPMFTYVGWLVVTVASSYLLVGRMGISGLALATTIGFTLLAAVLFELNRRELNGLGGRPLMITFARSVAGAFAMAGSIYLVQQIISGTIPLVVVGGLTGVSVYVLGTWLLGGRELQILWGIIRTRTS